MGTRIEVHIFADAVRAETLTGIRCAVGRMDDALTIHRPSPTTLLNEQLVRYGEAIAEDPILAEALHVAAALRDETGGLFDPASGSAVCEWTVVRCDKGLRVETGGPIAFNFGGLGKGLAWIMLPIT